MIKRNKFDFTVLANELLDQMPNEVFQSESTTFLDPAMGGGQFCYAIENRLREYGHSDENISQRVFGFESVIMDIRFAVNKYKLVGQYSLVKPTTFLETETLGMKFDVILGNPPYQKPNGSDRMGSRGANSLWDKFVFKSLDLVKDDGFVALIHPPAWRKPNDRYGLWKILTQDNQMLHLTMRSGKDQQDAFSIGVRFDYYVLQKTPKYKNTTVVDHEDVTYDLDLANYPWLPNFAISEISNMIGEGCEVLYNTKYHTQHDHNDKQTKRYAYPVVHTINQQGLGIKYFKDEYTDTHFGNKKVLLNQNELQYPVNDHKGEYGMSQLTFGIKITSKKQGDEIVKFLNSDKGKRIIAATKWNTFYTDYNMFKDFVSDWYTK